MRNRQATADAEDSAPAIAVHTGPFTALEGAWTALNDPRHPGAAFRSAAWLATWWNSGSANGEPHVLVARQAGEVVGILPLYAEPTALGGRRLRLMGDGIVGSDYLGVVARARDLVPLGRAFAEWLARAPVDELDLDGLSADDPLVAPLEAAYGRRAEVLPRYLCPHVRFGATFEAYFSALPDGIAAQWQRRRRWLEGRPGYRLDHLRTPAEIAVGMELLFDLHRRRWALDGGSDAIDGPRVESFHREAARRLASLGWAHLFVLHVEGAPRAALYGFRHGDRFAFYQSGHEPAWRPRSVGTVLLGHVLRLCHSEGLSEFDFLRGSEPYKFRWATGVRQTVRVRARAAGLRPWLNARGEAAIGELRRTVRRALPEPVWELARRARRRVREAAP
jgi:CelD/BcsL family acetyltransferase involved in cellulose biosynthesis